MRHSRRRFTLPAATILAVLGIVLFGCSDSDSPTAPPAPTLGLELAVLDLGITDIHAFTAGFTGIGGTELDWYVDGVLGGGALEGEDWETAAVSLDSEALGIGYAFRPGCTDCALRRFTVEEIAATARFCATSR
ncbi:MAG: hypothetical protein GY838_17220 [bacterium]|nr:hypothetical protein [bacterium]